MYKQVLLMLGYHLCLIFGLDWFINLKPKACVYLYQKYTDSDIENTTKLANEKKKLCSRSSNSR